MENNEVNTVPTGTEPVAPVNNGMVTPPVPEFTPATNPVPEVQGMNQPVQPVTEQPVTAAPAQPVVETPVTPVQPVVEAQPMPTQPVAPTTPEVVATPVAQQPYDPTLGYQIPVAPSSSSDGKRNVIILGVVIVALIVGGVLLSGKGSKEENGTTNNGGNNSGEVGKPSNDNKKTTTTTSTKENVVIRTTKKANTKVELNQLTTVDGGEFKIISTEITNKVEPPKKSGYYSYYEATNNKVYVDVVIEYKNTGASGVDADEVLNGKLIYRDHYTYTGFEIIEEDNRSDFTYASITSIEPLSTEYLHYLFEVPSVVKTDDGKLEATLTFGTKEFDFVLREGSTGTLEQNGSSKIVKDKELPKETTEIIKDICEVTIVEDNIASKIEPPHKDSYYTYYEAENGKVYVDVVFTYKNLGQDPKDAEEAIISGKLKYDNTYEYTGFTTIEEENGSDFTYTSITTVKPLVTDRIHYLFEVPAEVASSDKSIEVSFKVAENTYIYKLR